MTPQDLSQRRQRAHLTQKALGELLGYHANYIARLERGEEPITPRFRRLFQALVRKKPAQDHGKKENAC
jgi:predicted transcriptional regulator